jgi:hypothetical protein
VAGGGRYWVCDLCVSRALQDGWVREGTVPAYEPEDGEREHRRPLLPWLRTRLVNLYTPRDDGDFGFDEVPEPQPPVQEPERVAPRRRRRSRSFALSETERPVAAMRRPERAREPRHVHAVPTSPEQKVSSAISAFNGSEHTRTIAGVARSLGPPAVTIHPSELEASVVRVIAAWELCWYRYEVDLADELPSVRVAAQGAELDELQPSELESNASATEDGALALRG